jgi:hypothetical protein
LAVVLDSRSFNYDGKTRGVRFYGVDDKPVRLQEFGCAVDNFRLLRGHGHPAVGMKHFDSVFDRIPDVSPEFSESVLIQAICNIARLLFDVGPLRQ